MLIAATIPIDGEDDVKFKSANAKQYSMPDVAVSAADVAAAVVPPETPAMLLLLKATCSCEDNGKVAGTEKRPVVCVAGCTTALPVGCAAVLFKSTNDVKNCFSPLFSPNVEYK